MYDLFETEEFLNSIERLQKRDKALIKNKLKEYVYPQIKSEPYFGINIKKLRGYSPNTWRYRIGSYRVFYTIDENDKLVLLLIIESRNKAYKKS
ncbi:MAG: type II toxin-antitoxin system RelE/ParE family toxin [Gammaproteobacteria bacterium]|nr:type II toxin-antitoxin system RelE/ParE family toxin [Gammaproteobacteria bacterium]